MITTEAVQRFLRSQLGAQANLSSRLGRQPFITVSRQAGAGGHALGEAILKAATQAGKAEALLRGWQLFDSALYSRLLDDPKLHVPMRELADEEFHTEIEDYINHLVAGTSPQRQVYRRIFETVRTLATVGRAVLVGRAGAVITRDLPGGVHIRLVASRPRRIAAVSRTYGIDRLEAERRMDELDASRSRLLRTYFHRDIEDPQLYDAVFNADSMPLDAVAQAALDLVRERAEALDRSAAAA